MKQTVIHTYYINFILYSIATRIARSIVPNFNCITAAALLHSPDLICISETWLSPDILSSEISLSGYSLFRLDRSRHGGGVAIYAKSHLQPSLNILPQHSLELVSISILLHNRPLNITCFYWPPSFQSAISDLIDTLSPLGSNFASKNILVGDFNVNVHSPLFNQISSLASLLSFKQIVADPTHFSSTGSPSTIDLVFVPTSLSSSRAIVTSPIGNSDHLSILSQVWFIF